MAARLISTCVVVVAVGYLWQLVRTKQMDAGWLVVVAILAGVGVVLAGGYRVMTAGVIGANIGAGLFMLLGLPFCGCLVVVAGIVSFETAKHWTARQPLDASAN